MWRPLEDRDEGPVPVPICSFCGKETSCLNQVEVRGVTRYFCVGSDHAQLYEDLGQKTLGRRRILHNTDPIGDVLRDMWLACVKALQENPGV